MYLLAERNKQLNFRSRPAAVSYSVCGAVGSYISHMWVAGCASWVCEAGCLWEVWVAAAINGSRKLLCHFLGHCWKGRSRPAGDRRETDALSHLWQCSPTAVLHPHPTSARLGKHCSIAAWLRVPGESWHPAKLLDNECYLLSQCDAKSWMSWPWGQHPGPGPFPAPQGCWCCPSKAAECLSSILPLICLLAGPRLVWKAAPFLMDPSDAVCGLSSALLVALSPGRALGGPA